MTFGAVKFQVDVKDGGGGRVGDEFVDGPAHDPKRRKKIKKKKKPSGKILKGIIILNHDHCELHKHGWVFLFFISFHSFYHSHLLTLKAAAHSQE